jgi:hypothetical protein
VTGRIGGGTRLIGAYTGAFAAPAASHGARRNPSVVMRIDVSVSRPPVLAHPESGHGR